MIGNDRDDSDALYKEGMAYYGDRAWIKAFNCFQMAEMNISNKIGEKLKDAGLIESANEYFKRARRAKNRIFKPTPTGSYFLRYFLIITGIIALVCLIYSFILFPSTYFLLLLIILLVDLMAVIIILPFAIMQWATSRKRNPDEIIQRIRYIENEINQSASNQTLPELQKFLQIEKLKLRNVQLAQLLTRSEYTETELVSNKK